MRSDEASAPCRPLRIVVVNQVPSRPLLEVVACLAKRGHRVTLLAGSAACGCDIPRVLALPLVDYRSSSALTRLVSWLAFTVQAAGRLLVLPAPDLVVACTNPPIMPYAAAFVASLRHCAAAIRVLDVYPDVLRATRFQRYQFVARLLARGNRWAYARCRSISTIGAEMANALAAYSPCRRIAVIPEWSTFPCIDEAPPRTAGGRFVVLVSGNVGLTHDLSTIITASRILGDVNVEFLVSTNDVGTTSRMFAGCPNVRVVPRLDDSAYQKAMLSAHAAFVSLRQGAEAASLPSRLFDYLSHGLPIIAVTAPSGDLESLISRKACGIVVTPQDGATGLASAVRVLAGNPLIRHRMAEAALETARTDFAASRLLHEFVSWIENAQQPADSRPRCQGQQMKSFGTGELP